jgi:NAD(P)-dependent dehydrogenase (short-subunit alcohol dehydrogenase family)
MSQGTRLQAKVAIVTGKQPTITPPDSTRSSNNKFSIGGGSGFGAAIARRFGEEGAKVIVADINVEGGEKVAALNPSNLIFQRMDVTQEGDWKAVLDLAFSKFGRLDVLVNNAGVTYRNKVGYCQPHVQGPVANCLVE